MKHRIWIPLLVILLILALIGGIVLWRLYDQPVSTPIVKTLYGTIREAGSDTSEPIEIPIDGYYRHFTFGNDLDYYEGDIWKLERHGFMYATDKMWGSTHGDKGDLIADRSLDSILIVCYLDENGSLLHRSNWSQGSMHLILASSDPDATEESLFAQFQRVVETEHDKWGTKWEPVFQEFS